MESILIALIVISNLACIGFCQNIAFAKRLNGMKWGFAGLFFGIIALIAVCGMPENKS